MKLQKMLSVLSLCILLSLALAGCKSSDYNKASELEESGDYSAAVELYEGINNYENYKDTADRIDFCNSMIEAIDQFNTAQKTMEEKNSELDNAISGAEDLINAGETALDSTLIPALETSVSEAKAAKQSVPEMPSTEAEILEEAETLASTDYSEVLDNLSASQAALEKSIKQYALVDNPTEAYVIQCLENVEHIADISAVTEDNDPNGNLNKLGGYTATVYYSDDRLDLDEDFYGTTVIEQGTAGGGAIEVYTCVEDAEKRRDYLSTFDGTVTATGTHTVIGTVLVRTSDELMASQQEEMEAALIEALTYVED